MRLYFVRHGESEANLLHVISNRDLPHGLTANGCRQAQCLAQALLQAGVTRIYTSPIRRARQTADILAGVLQVDVVETPALREYDTGILEGRSDAAAWDQFWQVRQDWIAHHWWESQPAQGESFLDIQARFLPFIESLVEKTPGQQGNLILVGHGGLYTCMLPQILVNITLEFASRQPFPNTGYVLVEQRATGLVCLEWCGRALI